MMSFQHQIFMLLVCFIFIFQSSAQTTQSFTTAGSTTWTVPVGITSISVECYGGGGGGGGCTSLKNSTGGGGAGGSFNRINNIVVAPGAVYNLVVGAGGAGLSARNGDPGGTSSFSNIVSAAGGAGGMVNGNPTPLNGTGADYTQGMIYNGGAGGTGTASSSSGSSGAGGGGAGNAGNGGDASNATAGSAGSGGGGAGAAGLSGSGNGSIGNAPGGGGSGGRNGNTYSTKSGGKGGAGKVIIAYYCPTYSINSTAATSICSGNPSVISVTGSTANLPEGLYTVTYNLSGANAVTGATALLTISALGAGSFNTSNLNNAGTTNLTISSIRSGSGVGCSSIISANRTASFTVSSMPTPFVEFTQNALDTTANIMACGTVGGGGQNDMDIESGNPGGSAIIQWQVSYDLGLNWVDAPGPTASATQYVLNPVYCNFESIAGVYYFRVVITNGSCIGISNKIKLTVTGVSNLTPGTIGSNQHFCASGDPAAFTVIAAPTGAAGTYTYQWQSSADSITFTNISGATASTYNPSTISQTTFYRRITVSGGCRGVSNVVKVLITPSVLSAPNSISGYGLVCANSNSLNYFISSTPAATNYVWTVPNGWSIQSGQGSTSINVITGNINQSGNITVAAVNICGTGANAVLSVALTRGTDSARLQGDYSICSGGSSTLYANIQGGAMPYQLIYTDGTQLDTIENYLSGAAILVQPSISTTYSIVAVNSIGGCAGFNNQGSPAITLLSPGSWKGDVDDNWFNAANWCGGIPNAETDVYIPNGSSHYPIITTATAQVKNLTIATGAQLAVSNTLLKIHGQFIGNENLNCANGSLEFCSTDTTQAFSGSMFTGHLIKNLKISNQHDLRLLGTNDSLKITGVLEFGASNCTFYTNNNLTIASNATATGCIADMTAGGVLTGNHIDGNVTVEKYIALHPKSWRMMSVPTVGQTIKAAWQEGNASLSNINKPGYGTIITSNLSGATTTLGFDLFTPAGGTMKTYNANTDAWEGVASTQMPIANTKGYMLFVRGDRSVTAFNQAPTPLTLRTTGVLYTLHNNPPVPIDVAANKYETVGNPYAAAVDFSKITKTGGVQDAYYVWDPNLTIAQGSAYGLGGFQTIYRDGMGYSITPGGGSYANGNFSIKSGEAFFVRAIGTSGQVLFTEQSKIIDSSSVSRSASNVPTIKLNYALSNAGNPILLDGVVVQIDSAYSNGIDMQDISKIGNSTSENVSIIRNGLKLAVERRKKASTDTVFLQLGLLRRQAYQFTFETSNFSQLGYTAKLYDKQFNTTTSISLDSLSTFNFVVTQEAASYQPDRFYLVLTQTNTRKAPKLMMAASKINENAIPTATFVVSPNPVINKTMHLIVDNKIAYGTYSYEVIANDGRVVGRSSFTTNQTVQKVKLKLPQKCLPGNYIISIRDTNGKQISIPFQCMPSM